MFLYKRTRGPWGRENSLGHLSSSTTPVITKFTYHTFNSRIFTSGTSLPINTTSSIYIRDFPTQNFNIDCHNMRLSLSSAVGAILVTLAAAAPHNVTDTHISGRTGAATSVTEHVLPDAKIRCTGTGNLNATDVEMAKENAVRWGLEESVGKRMTLAWFHGDTALWICNCKKLRDDPVRRTELDEVLALLGDFCGPNQSGWVWSHKWKKGFGLNTRKNYRHTLDVKKCPVVGCAL